MNQGRIWCVVNPTVGLPLFLGSVTVIAIAVHYSVLSHTTWFSGYWQGGAKAKAAQNQTTTQGSVAQANSPGFTISVAPSTGADGKGATQFVVTVSPSALAGAREGPVADSRAASPPDKLVLAPTRYK